MFATAEQGLAFPVMVPGWAGTGLIVTANVWGGEMPHTLLAVIEIVPLVLFAVAVILLVADDPVQPEGKIQV